MLFQYIFGNMEIRHGIGFVSRFSGRSHFDAYGAFATTPAVFLFALLAIGASAYLILHVAENKASGNDEIIAFFSTQRESKVEYYYKQYFSNSETPFYLVEAIWYELLAYLGDYDHERIVSGDYFLKNPDAKFDFSSYKGFSLTFWQNIIARLNVGVSILEEYKANYTFKELVEYLKPKLKAPPRVLVVSNTDAHYSVFAEALINYLGKGRFSAFSAGSPQIAKLNPAALVVLESNGLSRDDYKSQSSTEFADEYFDIVISVGDSTTNDSCRALANSLMLVHWELPDLGQVTVSEEEIKKTTQQSNYIALADLVKKMLLMPIETMGSIEISRALNRIGKIL